jgi:hypothetical protein
MPLPFIPLALAAGGAIAGGLASKTGHKGTWSRQATQTPEQTGMANWAGQFGKQQVQNPYQGFEPIAQRAQKMFQQQTVPSLAERFTSLGSGNALSSGAFASQLGAAGNDLSTDLAGIMAQYGLQQQALGQNLMHMGMQPQFENVYTAGGPSFASGALGGLSSGLMGMAGGEAMLGSQGDYNNALARLFGNNQQPQQHYPWGRTGYKGWGGNSFMEDLNSRLAAMGR